MTVGSHGSRPDTAASRLGAWENRMRLTILGKTPRHKELAHMAKTASWCARDTPTTMALKFSNHDETTGNVAVVLTKIEAMNMAIDILKHAASLKDGE